MPPESLDWWQWATAGLPTVWQNPKLVHVVEFLCWAATNCILTYTLSGPEGSVRLCEI